MERERERGLWKFDLKIDTHTDKEYIVCVCMSLCYDS